MENRKATWLELFFDLIFVVALGKVTHLLAEPKQGHFSLEEIVTFSLLFISFWWVWTLHTSFSNRVKCDRNLHKILTLVLMFLLIILSTTLNSGVQNNHITFLIFYVLVKICLTAIYITDIKAVENRAINKRIISALIIGSALAICGVFLSLEAAAILLISSIVLEIVIIQTALNAQTTTQPANKEHLVERIGLLAIVLLGESIISISYGLTKVEWEPMNILAGVIGFSIIGMIWWIYFGSLRLLIESKKDAYGTGIIYSQLFVFMSFAVLANAIRHAILNDLPIIDFRIMAISGMAMLYIGKQTAYAINYPQYMKSRIVRTTIVLTIAGVSLFLNRAEFILMGIAISFMVYIMLTYRDQENPKNKVLENHSN